MHEYMKRRMKAVDDQVKQECAEILLRPQDRLAVMSDLHRGVGNGSDNFARNQMLFLSALKYYHRKGYSYLELGDGDELWENRRMEPIVEEYPEVFQLLAEFYRQRRLYIVYGNHDLQKRKQKQMQAALDSFWEPCCRKSCPLFPDFSAREGYRIVHQASGTSFLAVHGHQGDPINDRYHGLTKLLVRFVWGPLERIGARDPSEGSIHRRARSRQEKRLAAWAQEEERYLIAGHTHQPRFADEREPFYFNCGCGVQNGYLTALEFDKEKLLLVKWLIVPDEQGVLKVAREVLQEESYIGKNSGSREDRECRECRICREN